MKVKTVEKSDLIGAIKDFPIEVVQQMVNEQVKQGNKADVVLFQGRVYAARVSGGFDWERSFMGLKFWRDVLINERFDTFFQKYQKNEK